MNPRALCGLAARLMQHPAAPYHEHAVSSEVQKICHEHGLRCEKDAFGNVLVRIGQSSARAAKLRPIVFAAHMDHPGFEILSSSSNDRLRVRFQGGVSDAYFRKGLVLRLMPRGGNGNCKGRDNDQSKAEAAKRAKLGRRVGSEKIFEIESPKSSDSNPAFAVWNLEDFSVRRGQIHGRACDDLVGVASALAALIELKRSRARVNAMAAISRAEEIGFRGALALSRSRLLPKTSLMISLETSRELPGAKMGQGVILRVGDRTSVFDSDAMRFLGGVAGDLKTRRKAFQFQRALMSGGTCEATAYQEYGFQTGAVCVALGNYHNCAERNRIAAEYVNIADACSMVDLLVEAARKMSQFNEIVERLPNRLESMRQEGLRALRATV